MPAGGADLAIRNPANGGVSSLISYYTVAGANSESCVDTMITTGPAATSAVVIANKRSDDLELSASDGSE